MFCFVWDEGVDDGSEGDEGGVGEEVSEEEIGEVIAAAEAGSKKSKAAVPKESEILDSTAKQKLAHSKGDKSGGAVPEGGSGSLKAVVEDVGGGVAAEAAAKAAKETPKA